MRIAVIDPAAGISGDMTLGSLLSLGLPALRGALTNQIPALQTAAAEAVWTIHRETNLVLHACMNVIMTSMQDVAFVNAARRLSQLGPDAAPAVPALFQPFQDVRRSVEARASAAIALGTIGVNDQAVISALLEGTKDSDWRLRTTCARALWRLDTQFASVAVPIIVDWIVDWNKRKPPVEQEFTRLIKSDKVDLATAIPALTELLNRGSPEVRQVADDALKRIQSKENDGDAQP